MTQARDRFLASRKRFAGTVSLGLGEYALAVAAETTDSTRPISDGGRLGPPCAKRPLDATRNDWKMNVPDTSIPKNSRAENGETWERLSVIINARNYIWSAS
jgi:hypothetical protein